MGPRWCEHRLDLASMLPRKTIDRFETKDGHVFTLIRHDADFYIEIDGQELMSTRRTGSEIALARLGCEELGELEKPRVLIGGLGFGFTLRDALDHLPPDGRLVVAELFTKVVEWNRVHLEGLYAGTLQDPRLKIVVADVWEQIGRGGWGSIMLDTDNGPEYFCLPGNSRLYRCSGLERIHDALVPGGTLAVWSADAQPSFVKALKRTGFDARCVIVRERGNRGQSYAIHLGKKLVRGDGRGRRVKRAHGAVGPNEGRFDRKPGKPRMQSGKRRK